VNQFIYIVVDGFDSSSKEIETARKLVEETMSSVDVGR
jgi:hypothetical protein